MSGGSLDAQSLAVGRNARAVVTLDAASAALQSRGWNEIAETLRALHSEIRATDVGGTEAALHALEMVADELRGPNPDGATVRGVLDGIASTLGAAGGVTNAVVALKTALEGLI